MYGNEKNPSRVFDIYERLFELKTGDIFVSEFYGELKGLINELEMHQHVVTDAATLRGYHQDLAGSKFLSGLSPTLRSQVQGQILRGDNIPTLATTFSRVMARVSNGSDISSTPSSLSSFMGVAEVVAAISEDEDVDPLDVNVNIMEADRVPLKNASDNVSIVDVVISCPKSVGRNLVDLSGHNYLSLILLPCVVLLRSPHLLIQPLSHLYCRRRGMINSDS